MAKPALMRDESQLTEDGLADGEAGSLPGANAEDPGLETGGVVTPFARKGGRRYREADPAEAKVRRLFAG